MAFRAESLSVHCQYSPQFCLSSECCQFSEQRGLILACCCLSGHVRHRRRIVGISIGGDSEVCNVDMLGKYMETVVGDIEYNKMKISLSSLFFFLP